MLSFALEQKDIVLLVFGALAGAFFGVLFQNILFPRISEDLTRRKSSRRLKRVNAGWKSFESLFPMLKLQQAGWSQDGSFEPNVIRIKLSGDFKLPNDINQIRARYNDEWLASGATDDEKIGITSLSIRRKSDDPLDEIAGSSHDIRIISHSFRYFDFLATHRRLAIGKPEDIEILNKHLSTVGEYSPIDSFPNPLSVGLSLFCEAGNVLVFTLRTQKTEGGGDWHGGKRFNAVGENTNRSDFSTDLGGALISSPYTVARRGLYEEMGFTSEDADLCTTKIHSLAWASDIRDHKFFGYAVSTLAESEVRSRWDLAPDRHEHQKIFFIPVQTRTQSLRFWHGVLGEANTWSPEALFCTARSLVLLGHLKPQDLLPVGHRQGKNKE